MVATAFDACEAAADLQTHCSNSYPGSFLRRKRESLKPSYAGEPCWWCAFAQAPLVGV